MYGGHLGGRNGGRASYDSRIIKAMRGLLSDARAITRCTIDI